MGGFVALIFWVPPRLMAQLLLFWKDRARTIFADFSGFFGAALSSEKGKGSKNAVFFL